MGISSSILQDPELRALFPRNGSENDRLIHDLYKGENLAKTYAAYRPHYPREVYHKIISYHDEMLTNVRGLAVDVCCGTGNSTLPLVQLFTKVVGVDISQDQISHLPKDVPNLTSHVSVAEDLPMIASATVDLVTIATGLHWLNIDKFFVEVQRILKPGGTFATYAWIMDKLDNEEANSLYRETMSKFKEYFTSRPILSLEKFESIDFPFEDLKRLDIEMREEMTIDQFMGCLQSLHCTKLYCEAHPGTRVLEDVRDRMMAIVASSTSEQSEGRLKMTKYFCLILGRNKQEGVDLAK